MSERGRADLDALGIDVPPIAHPAAARRFAYPCLDWSERRDHLAGGLAVLLLAHFVGSGWLRRRFFSNPDTGFGWVGKKGRRHPVRRLVETRPLEFDPEATRADFAELDFIDLVGRALLKHQFALLNQFHKSGVRGQGSGVRGYCPLTTDP